MYYYAVVSKSTNKILEIEFPTFVNLYQHNLTSPDYVHLYGQ